MEGYGYPAQKKEKRCYEIMHADRLVARVDLAGKAQVLSWQYMPFDLYLEEETDIDARLNNLENFYHWCASRMLTLDRTYAKEILNSIGAPQAVTDRERAQVVLSYHAVSLTDVYWVRPMGEACSFAAVNLYDNSLSKAVIPISLRGKQMTATNQELAQDLSTAGCFPKAWIQEKDGFWLLKDGDADAVQRELAASAICRCFDIPQVEYEEAFYDGEPVTRSRLVTSRRYSLVTKMAFDIYAVNHDLNTLEICKRLDPVGYYGMNILDYLTGNTDRHPENWGFLVDNETNQAVSLYPLMDFNRAFFSYDTLEGANCLTVLPAKQTQREAAIEAVRRIGLRQKCEPDPSLFGVRGDWAEMFERRLRELKKQESGTAF